MLRQSNLEGFDMPDGGERLIATLFADDTTVYLSCEDDFDELTIVLDKWCAASRARFNISKTEVIPVGTEDYRQWVITHRKLGDDQNPIPIHIRIAKDGEASRSLGARVGNNLSEDTEWDPTLTKIDARQAFWIDRDRYPALHLRKNFSDWIYAGMTQFLAAAQGMPKSAIERVTKWMQAFIWQGSKRPTVNKQTLSQSKFDGGLGIIDLSVRIEAIHLMRLKAWLTAAEKPRWVAFAIALLAMALNEEYESQVAPEQRWDPFLQDWKPTSKSSVTRKWPPELKALIKTARKHGVSIHLLAPTKAVKRELPIWHH
ncbi:hypothetical protein PENSPDRAFT_595189, partial [Peniophora sp. CONT]